MRSRRLQWSLTERASRAGCSSEVARKRFKALVESGKARGVLAFADGEPVGWCSYGPRTSFSKLDRSPSLACDDAATVWSLPCFFVKAGFRQKGVSSKMLEFALACLKKEGAKVVEGYPVKPTGKAIPAAFAFTGTRPLFDKHGFAIAGNKDGGKQRMRLAL